MPKLAVAAWLAVLCAAAPARAADFFVVMDTSKSQREAQMRAAASGGSWVLDTDAYTGMAPGMFAVVAGPYATRQAADRRLKDIQKAHRSAYVKDAGDLRIAPAFAKSVPPKVLAALLGELSIVVKDEPGGENPCEPQEPYQEVSVSVVTLERTGNVETETEGVRPRRTNVDIGAFWVIKRTGEIERMRLCTE